MQNDGLPNYSQTFLPRNDFKIPNFEQIAQYESFEVGKYWKCKMADNQNIFKLFHSEDTSK